MPSPRRSRRTSSASAARPRAPPNRRGRSPRPSAPHPRARPWPETTALSWISRMAKELNSVDLAIIDILQREGRITFAQIASEVGLSAAAVHERVKKLENRGVITGYHARVDPVEVGVGVTAFISVSETAGPRGRLEEIFERLPWSEGCHHVAGEESLLLKVRAESTRALEHIIWEIRALEAVERTKTTVVLATSFEGRPVAPATSDSDVESSSGWAGGGAGWRAGSRWRASPSCSPLRRAGAAPA